MHNSQSRMSREGRVAPEQEGASELSVTHIDKGDHEGTPPGGAGASTRMMSAVLPSSSPNSQPSTKDKEAGGAHRVGQYGGDNNKIRSTDFSSLKVPFPWRLWQLLEDSEKNGNQSIVSWLPEGDGIAISKPRTFTNTIMKAYFALTTYDSFVEELLKYGFTRTTIEEDNLKRVEVFRNPRYNRKEKLKSLAIRRRSLTRSFTERLTATAKEQQDQCGENNEIVSCYRPSSEDCDTQNDNNRALLLSLLPITSQPQARNGFNQNFQVATHDATGLHEGGVMESSSSSPLTSSFFFPNTGNRSDFRGRGYHDAGDNHFAFMIEAHKEFQHTHDGTQCTCFPSITQQHGEVSFLSLDQISTQRRSSTSTQEGPAVYRNQQDNPSTSTGRLPTRTSDQNDPTELLRRAWQFLETSGNDVSSRPQTMRDRWWLTGTLPARPSMHFSSTFSQLSQISDNVEIQQELEKILDEDIMDSIFD